MSPSHRIPVRLGKRSYDISIGSGQLGRLGSSLKQLRLGTHPVVVTNPTVLKIHGKAVARALIRSGFSVQILTVPDTEKSKSLPTLSRLLTRLASLDAPGRTLFLVLVGGGVVGDVGGLAAGLYRRGIPYIQIPTTLLAQVDSSVGGKTGVDLPQGKNLVGLFEQPRLVVAETSFVRTLPDRQFHSGLAEAAKCGIIRDRELFEFLERIPVSKLKSSDKDLAWVISRAVRVKVAVVEADERETKGIRTLLNFGHTVGHAIEAACHYSRAYTHGEAVGLGVLVATDIALTLKMIPASSADRIHLLIRHLGLPTVIRGIRLRDMVLAMSHDKKWASGRSRWVLPTGIGQAVMRRDVPHGVVQEAFFKRMGG